MTVAANGGKDFQSELDFCLNKIAETRLQALDEEAKLGDTDADAELED